MMHRLIVIGLIAVLGMACEEPPVNFNEAEGMVPEVVLASSEDVRNILVAVEEVRMNRLEEKVWDEIEPGDHPCPTEDYVGQTATYGGGCTAGGLRAYEGTLSVTSPQDITQPVEFVGDNWTVTDLNTDDVRMFTGTWIVDRFTPADEYRNADSATGIIQNTAMAHLSPSFSGPIEMHQYDWVEEAPVDGLSLVSFSVDLTLPIYGNVSGWYEYRTDDNCMENGEAQPIGYWFALDTPFGLLESVAVDNEESCRSLVSWRIGDLEGRVDMDDVHDD